MEVFVRHLRTQTIASGAFNNNTDRYWAERQYAQSLLKTAGDVMSVLTNQSSEIMYKLVLDEMDREWERSWFLPEREKLRVNIIDTITESLSRIGIKISARTRDGVVIEGISTEKMSEIKDTVQHLYPGITPMTRFL